MGVEYQKQAEIVQGAFIVYIAGVQVPAISVNVNFGINTMPVASVTLVADKELVKLGEEDRVPLVVFYLDKWYSPVSNTSSVGVEPTWRLLFDGDITQWVYSRTSSSRNMTFNAISHLSVLNAMRMTFLNGKGESTLQNLHKTRVSSTGVARVDALAAVSMFTKGAFGNGKITRPMDFIKNLLTGMQIGGQPKTNTSKDINNKESEAREAGVYSSMVSSTLYADQRATSQSEVSASSEFFIKYNYKNRISSRWVASSLEDITLLAGDTEVSDKSAKEISTPTKSGKPKTVTSDAFEASIKSMVAENIQNRFSQKKSPNSTFWELITEFYDSILYTLLKIPTAPFVSVDEDDVPTNGVSAEDRIANCISMPNAPFALPPACNVFTPAMLSSFSFSEDYGAQCTRTIINGNYARRILNRSLKALEQAKLSVGYPLDQHRLMEVAASENKNQHNIMVFPEETFRGPVVNEVNSPDYLAYLEQTSVYARGVNQKEIDVDSIQLVSGQPRMTDGEDIPEITATEDAYKVSIKDHRVELMYGFVKYHHLQNKYQYRSGTLSLAFNPYVIPGMTFVALDGDDYDNFHFKGFVTGVSINMSLSSMTTSVQYGLGRTLQEVYEEVFVESTFGPDLGVTDKKVTGDKDTNINIYATAPVEPIKQVADTFQVEDNAADYYKTLLYSKDKVNNDAVHPYVFRVNDYFKSTTGEELANKDGNLDPNMSAKLRTVGASTAATFETNAVATKRFPGTISNVIANSIGDGFSSFNLELNLKEEASESIHNYTTSMQKAARPICSLDEYMRHLNNSSDYSDLVLNMTTEEEFGVEYPVVLRKYLVDPEKLGDNYIRPSANEIYKEMTTSEFRRDWPSKLHRYREKIINNKILG